MASHSDNPRPRVTEEMTVEEYRAKYRRSPTAPRPDRNYNLLVRAIGDFCTTNDYDLPAREYRFALPERQWRFDFAWVRYKIALEYEGGVWTNGRHVRGTGYSEDCLKYSTAAIKGWIVLRVTIDLVKDGIALALLGQALRLGAARAALEDEGLR